MCVCAKIQYNGNTIVCFGQSWGQSSSEIEQILILCQHNHEGDTK